MYPSACRYDQPTSLAAARTEPVDSICASESLSPYSSAPKGGSLMTKILLDAGEDTHEDPGFRDLLVINEDHVREIKKSAREGL